MNKFGRQYVLTVDGNDGTHQFKYPTTLQFSVHRDSYASSNTGRFVIRNLDKTIRNSLLKARFQFISPFRKVKLEAGYEGSPLSVIFNGNVSECRSYREEGSVDFVTEIDAFGMSNAIVNSFSDGSAWNISPTPRFQEVIGNLINDLKRYEVQEGIVGNFPGVHYRPYKPTGNGNTWECLKTETNNHCFFDNGKVYCLQDNEAITGDIQLITSVTGLLGTPKITDNYLTLQCMFEPRVIVGQFIYVQSRSVPNQWNQLYKVVSISHDGVISGTVNGKCKSLISVYIANNITFVNQGATLNVPA